MPNVIYRMEAICSQKAAVRHKTENHSQNPEDNKMSAILYAKKDSFIIVVYCQQQCYLSLEHVLLNIIIFCISAVWQNPEAIK